MSRLSIRGRTKTSLTKLLNLEGVECKKGQKDADGHSGMTRVPKPLQASDGTHYQRYWRANRIDLTTPILGKRVYSAAARRSKFGVKPGKLGIIIRSKPPILHRYLEKLLDSKTIRPCRQIC